MLWGLGPRAFRGVGGFGFRGFRGWMGWGFGLGGFRVLGFWI